MHPVAILDKISRLFHKGFERWGVVFQCSEAFNKLRVFGSRHVELKKHDFSRFLGIYARINSKKVDKYDRDCIDTIL